MNYELAKELKDAGFPQTFDAIPAVNPIIQPNRYDRGSDGDLILIPTLEELIEACGTGFSSLSYGSFGWTVYGVGEGQVVVEAPTCLEGVARLWLALNAPKS